MAYGVEFHGPFHDPIYRLTVNDYEVPYLTASMDLDSDRLILILDRRFMIEANREEAERWLGFLADAMAIAAGFSSHGEHSGPVNPFHHRVVAITSVETEEPDRG